MMALKSEAAAVVHGSPAVVDKRGEPILIQALDERLHQQLSDAYLAYRPRDSFEGLPPIRDEACVKWAQDVIRDGISLVALSSEGDIAGHAAIFPVDQHTCEMLLVVWPQYQGCGLGTELIRCVIELARQHGFSRIWLSADAANHKAMHVFKKCGFRNLTDANRGDIEMAMEIEGR